MFIITYGYTRNYSIKSNYNYHIQQYIMGWKTFMIFHLIVNLFLRIMALLISNINLQKCYSEGFTANSHFPFKT